LNPCIHHVPYLEAAVIAQQVPTFPLFVRIASRQPSVASDILDDDPAS
jgi:hypothetical protein